MSMFRTEMLTAPAYARDRSSAMSRRPRRYGVSTARLMKPLPPVACPLVLQPAVNEDALPPLHRAA